MKRWQAMIIAYGLCIGAAVLGGELVRWGVNPVQIMNICMWGAGAASAAALVTVIVAALRRPRR